MLNKELNMNLGNLETEEESTQSDTTGKQKKVWEDAGVFNTYAEAKAKMTSLQSESKIRRCGPAGSKYKVKRVVKILESK